MGEVELEGGTAWFLHVRRVCGPLLYASYLGTGTHVKRFLKCRMVRNFIEASKKFANIKAVQ